MTPEDDRFHELLGGALVMGVLALVVVLLLAVIG